MINFNSADRRLTSELNRARSAVFPSIQCLCAAGRGVARSYLHRSLQNIDLIVHIFLIFSLAHSARVEGPRAAIIRPFKKYNERQQRE